MVSAGRRDGEHGGSERYLDKLAWVMDNAIRIPGTGARIGFDGILGLIPGLGDTLGALISGVLLVQAARKRLPASLLVRMAANVGIEWLIGVVPFVGDLFDFAWKANTRNLDLYRRGLRDRRGSRVSSRLFLLGLVVILFALIAGIVAAVMALLGRLAAAGG